MAQRRKARPSGQTIEEAFKWFMPEEPPTVDGLPPDQQPCWDWRGTIMGTGYGTIKYNNQPNILAHRASHLVYKGDIGDGLNILHSCDRPICVQPAHLRAGTQVDNFSDAISRGRWTVEKLRAGIKKPQRGCPGQTWTRGSHNGQSKLTEADVYAIRASTCTQRETALRYGIDPSTVSDIKRRKRWAHLPEQEVS